MKCNSKLGSLKNDGSLRIIGPSNGRGPWTYQWPRVLKMTPVVRGQILWKTFFLSFCVLGKLDVRCPVRVRNEGWEPMRTDKIIWATAGLWKWSDVQGCTQFGKTLLWYRPLWKPTSTMEGNKVSVRALAIFVVLVWIMATWRPDKLRFHEDSLGSNIGQHRWSHSRPTMQFWIAKMSLWNASHESFPLGGIISWGWVSQAIFRF